MQSTRAVACLLAGLFLMFPSIGAAQSSGIRRAAEDNPWPRYAVRAFVVATDEQFGLLRMYQALGNPKTDDVGITRSVAEAEDFIARERARLGIAI